MASHRKLSAGRYQVRWSEPDGNGGKVQRSRVVSTAEARDTLTRLVTRCEDLGIRYEPEQPKRVIPTIGAAMTAYAVDLKRTRSTGTLKNYREALAAFCDYLDVAGHGHATVAELHRDMLTGFFSHLENGRWGKPRSADTKRRIVEKIESAWQWLFETEWDDAVPRPKTIEMPSTPQRAVVAPSWGESAACVLACRAEGPRRLATVLYYTGCRVGQAMALRWSDVDLDRALLTVAPHKGLPGYMVPISAHLVRELAAWGLRDGPVITWRPVRQARERVIAAAWESAGVREAVWRRRQDHAFRRGFVSGLAALGVTREAAELLVGHGIAGTRGHYLDHDYLPLREAVALIPSIDGAAIQSITARRA